MISLLVPLNSMHQVAPHDLKDDKHVNCQSNAMVRIRQAPFRPDGKPAQHKHNGTHEQSQNLTPHMQLESPVWIPSRIVSYYQNGRGNEAEKGDCRKNTMGAYHRTVIRHISKPISHAYHSQSYICQSSEMLACTHHCTAWFQNSDPSNWEEETYRDPSPMFHHQRVEYSRSMYCSLEQTSPDWATYCPLINREFP